jgi:hypothetical protein
MTPALQSVMEPKICKVDVGGPFARINFEGPCWDIPTPKREARVLSLSDALVHRMDDDVSDESSNSGFGGCSSGDTVSTTETSLSAVVEGCLQHRDGKPVTTIMIRNIPNRYSQRKLINELKGLGFDGAFDFVYAPLDSKTLVNVGYAFVNFKSPQWALRCVEVFREHRFKQQRRDKKFAAVSIAHVQGLDENMRHYEKSVARSHALKQRRPFTESSSEELAGEGSPNCFQENPDGDN